MMVSQPRSEMWWKWNKSTTDKTSRQIISQSPLLRCCKSNGLKWNEKVWKNIKKDKTSRIELFFGANKSSVSRIDLQFYSSSQCPLMNVTDLVSRVPELSSLSASAPDQIIVNNIFFKNIFIQLTSPPQCWCPHCLCPTPPSLGAIWQCVTLVK